MEELKAEASKFLMSITELTKDLADIVIDYLEFEPENIISLLDFESLKNYKEAIRMVYPVYKKWVITENRKRDYWASKQTLVDVYYYDPKMLKYGHRQEYVLIGKFDCEDRDVYFMLKGKEATTISLSGIHLDWQGKLTFSSTWTDLYLYGLDNDLLRDKCPSKGWFD